MSKNAWPVIKCWWSSMIGNAPKVYYGSVCWLVEKNGSSTRFPEGYGIWFATFEILVVTLIRVGWYKVDEFTNHCLSYLKKKKILMVPIHFEWNEIIFKKICVSFRVSIPVGMNYCLVLQKRLKNCLFLVLVQINKFPYITHLHQDKEKTNFSLHYVNIFFWVKIYLHQGYFMMSSHCHCSTNCQQMNRCQCKR
jgi:hypothetical protein